MKFTIATHALNALLIKIQNVVNPKPTIPILSNFLIEATYDELILTATDLTVGIRCYTDTEATIVEEGSITLPAKLVAQLLREITASDVSITTIGEVANITAGSAHFKVNGMNKNEFPSLPDLSGNHTLRLQQKDLKNAFYCTSFAVSKDDSRYVLTGILISITPGLVTFAATDGRRLARVRLPIESSSFNTQSIIPLKAVDEIAKNLTQEGEVIMTFLQDKLGIEVNQTRLITKLLSGEYPDINRVIPESSEIIVSLHREELMTLLRQVSLFTTDHHHSVRFTFTEGELQLTANTMEIGEGHVGMPANYLGTKLEVAFNPGFFIDVLRHCEEETVTLGLVDAYNPCILVDGHHVKDLNQLSPLFVIMPMRLSED